MLTEICFENFGVLAHATLTLSPMTLIVGPNGSGKSTALRALAELQPVATLAMQQMSGSLSRFDQIASFAIRDQAGAVARVSVTSADGNAYERTWSRDMPESYIGPLASKQRQPGTNTSVSLPLSSRVFILDSDAIAAAAPVKSVVSLSRNGGDLVGVLQALRDGQPERFAELVDELQRWLPDYDNILFQTPRDGQKSVALRSRVGRHPIPASNLSQGTLFALALLTIAYMPDPPDVIGIEEPDRGIHPRLLRDVRDALYRLAYPESVGAGRPAVQVIATTHSPYMVDLFGDHPEELVLAERNGLHATFRRLVDQAYWEEIVRDAALGDLWYSGVLGGVPAGT